MWPDDQSADTSSSEVRLVYAFARPASQSTTDFAAWISSGPPAVGHPSESPVPGDSAWTTAKPRGSQVDSSDVLIVGEWYIPAQPSTHGLLVGGSPSSWSTGQSISASGPRPE